MPEVIDEVKPVVTDPQKTDAPKAADVSNDDIKITAQQARAALGYELPKVQEPQTKVEAKVEDTKPADKPQEPAKPAEPPKQEPVKAQRKPRVSAAEAAAIAAEAAKQALASQPRVPEPQQPTKQQPQIELAPSEWKELAIAAEMAAANPEYQGKDRELFKFFQLKKDYEKQWVAANPGKKFNLSDPEHEEWHEEHAVVLDPDERDEARIRMVARQQLKEDRDRENQQRGIETAAATMADTAQQLISTADITLANLVVNLGVDKSQYKEVKDVSELDPYSARVLKIMSAKKEKVLTAFASMTTPGAPQGVIDNETADYVMSEIKNAEEIFTLGRNDSETGKVLVKPDPTFVPLNEWAKLSPQQRQGRWTFSARDVYDIQMAALTRDIKNEANEWRQIDENRRASEKAASDKAAAEAAAAAKPKTPSPSTASGSDNTPGGSGGESLGAMARKAMYG